MKASYPPVPTLEPTRRKPKGSGRSTLFRRGVLDKTTCYLCSSRKLELQNRQCAPRKLGLLLPQWSGGNPDRGVIRKHCEAGTGKVLNAFCLNSCTPGVEWANDPCCEDFSELVRSGEEVVKTRQNITCSR